MKVAPLVFVGLAGALIACANVLPDGKMESFEGQVASLYVTHQGFDEDRPWAKINPSTRVVAAAVVDGALLTSAHMMENATLVQAMRLGRGGRWAARVAHSDAEINLALVTVDDPAFFEGLRPVRFAPALPTEGFVRSVRWKDAQLETTESRISRLEIRRNHFNNIEHAFLRVRTDVEGGGWSEPVFHDGLFAGLTSSQEEDQRASIVPPEILRTYVETARGGDYRGFASLGVDWQVNRDAALSTYLGLEGPPRGVVIRAMQPGGSACGVLRARDVLLSLDGYEIDAVGNYQHPVYGRIRFTHIALDGHRPGDILTARVLRDKNITELRIQLRSDRSLGHPIPWRRTDAAPPYIVAGGFVFRELDGNFIRTWGTKWKESAPIHLTYLFYFDNHPQTAERRRVVLITSVLPDAYNLGYHDLEDRIVESVNGIPVDSIADVQKAFGSPSGGFHTIGLVPNGGRLEIVLDAEEFDEATDRILARYSIPQPVRLAPELSPDLGIECDAF